MRISDHKMSKDVSFYQSELIHVVSNVLSVRIPCHILARPTTFHQCGLSHVFSKES